MSFKCSPHFYIPYVFHIFLPFLGRVQLVVSSDYALLYICIAVLPVLQSLSFSLDYLLSYFGLPSLPHFLDLNSCSHLYMYWRLSGYLYLDMSLGTIDLKPAVSVSLILLQRHWWCCRPGVMPIDSMVISLTHLHQLVLMFSLIADTSSLILNYAFFHL